MNQMLYTGSSVSLYQTVLYSLLIGAGALLLILGNARKPKAVLTGGVAELKWATSVAGIGIIVIGVALIALGIWGLSISGTSENFFISPEPRNVAVKETGKTRDSSIEEEKKVKEVTWEMPVGIGKPRWFAVKADLGGDKFYTDVIGPIRPDSSGVFHYELPKQANTANSISVWYGLPSGPSAPAVYGAKPATEPAAKSTT